MFHLADRQPPSNAQAVVWAELVRLAGDRFVLWLRLHRALIDGSGRYLYWRRVGDVHSALLTCRALRPSTFGRLRDVLDDDRATRAAPARGCPASRGRTTAPAAASEPSP